MHTRFKVRSVSELLAARDALRTMPRGEGWRGAVIELQAGRYPVASAIAFTAADSGRETAPVRVVARGEVILDGTETISRNAWAKVTDAAIRSRLPESVRDLVLVAPATAVLDRDTIFAAAGLQQPRTRWPADTWGSVAAVPSTNTITPNPALPSWQPSVLAESWGEGYWQWDWRFVRASIASATGGNFTLAAAPQDGLATTGKFFLANVLEELTQPGEWCFLAGKVYWLPPNNQAAQATINATQTFLTATAAQWLHFEGLTIIGGRGDAVALDQCTSVRFDAGRITQCAGRAITVVGGSRCTVHACELTELGYGGVYLDGGDRITLTRSDHLADSCTIRDFARMQRTYEPGVRMWGVGQTTRNCTIEESPHAGVLMSGNDHSVEDSHFRRLTSYSSDAAAIYGGNDPTFRGWKILRCDFRETAPGLPIYLDDQLSGVTVEDCDFWNLSRGLKVGGGRDLRIRNNRFHNCAWGVGVDGRGLNVQASTWAVGGTNRNKLAAMPYQTPPWSTRYPELLTLLDDNPGAPKGSIYENNQLIGGGVHSVDAAAAPYVTIA